MLGDRLATPAADAENINRLTFHLENQPVNMRPMSVEQMPYLKGKNSYFPVPADNVPENWPEKQWLVLIVETTASRFPLPALKSANPESPGRRGSASAVISTRKAMLFA
jgi:hypothetical protein